MQYIVVSAESLPNGGVSDLEVKLEGEILFRRDLGKKLMFLTLCRVGTRPQEGSQEDWGKNDNQVDGSNKKGDQVDKCSDELASNACSDVDKEMHLQIALEESSYHNPSDFRFDTDLLRIGAIAKFVGLVGKAIKVHIFFTFLFLSHIRLITAQKHHHKKTARFCFSGGKRFYSHPQSD